MRSCDRQTLHVGDDLCWRSTAYVENGIVSRGACVEQMLLGQSTCHDGVLVFLVGTEQIVGGEPRVASADPGSDMLCNRPLVGAQAHHRNPRSW